MKARAWKSTVCCEVRGICRSIWNKSRFACPWQCSAAKVLRRLSGAFLLRHPLTHVRAGRYRTRTARHRRRRGNKHPSGVFVSARFPTHRNVYRDDCRFGVDGTGLEQQRRRPPPAAETGSRGWDSVLIFQSPAKGLRKNQQTQPVQAPAVRFRQGSQRLGMSIKKDAARLIRVRSFCFGGQYRTRTGTSKGRVPP